MVGIYACGVSRLRGRGSRNEDETVVWDEKPQIIPLIRFYTYK